VVQGSAFGLGPAFRISYATKTSDLEETPASASSTFVAICDSQITSSSLDFSMATSWKRLALDKALPSCPLR